MAICISASGKVLLAGGYLVLDPEYSGVVVSTSSRFYTVINPLDKASPQIVVRSPQFKDAVWTYDVSIDSSVTVNSSGSRLVYRTSYFPCIVRPTESQVQKQIRANRFAGDIFLRPRNLRPPEAS
jgi:phosphomevalonate kinase